MKHETSSVKVYKSLDYKLFKNVKGNRSINKKKVERIIGEIKSGNDVLNECPILVTETGNYLEVKDGQHRLEVARQLRRPVHYIIHKSQMSLYNVAKVNSNVEKWKPIDFINCYATAGNDDYVKLGDFHRKYGIAVGGCLSLLTYGIQKHDGTIADLFVQFEQGTFQIKKWKEAVQFAEILKSFSDFKGWNARGFIVAMSKVITAGKCDVELLLRKFKEDPRQLQHHGHWKGFITNLEEIYNKGNSKRRVIW